MLAVANSIIKFNWVDLSHSYFMMT